jgi:hypothetical protein
MKADDVKRLKELELKNARLNQIVADQTMQVQALREIAEGSCERVVPAPGGGDVAGPPGISERRAARIVGSIARPRPPAGGRR